MKEFYKVIEKSKLFSDIKKEELDGMLKCLSVSVKEYKKGEFIFSSGEDIKNVGLVLSGDVHIIKEDYWGNRTIIAEITVGGIFGEAYACSNDLLAGVSAVAADKCKIMLLDVRRVIKICPSACEFHLKLIQNLITVLAEKNIMLTGKIEHISQRKLRDKVLSYLSEQSRRKGSPVFEIPYNRQELADYLSVDRSALSNELCKLRDEGVLNFNKNRFTLN